MPPASQQDHPPHPPLPPGVRVQPASEAELAAMIADADTDGDGRVSLEDFKHVVEQCQ